MKITFRKAVAEDLPEILLLYKAVVRNMLQSGIDQWGDEYPNKDVLSGDIENNDLIIAHFGERIIGAFVMNEFADEDYYKADWQYPDLKWCVIHRLCVLPSFHKQGVALKMMEYAENKARMDGFGSIHLDTFSGNPKALSLYHKLGFTDVGEAFWPRGRFIIMEKKLI